MFEPWENHLLQPRVATAIKSGFYFTESTYFYLLITAADTIKVTKNKLNFSFGL